MISPVFPSAWSTGKKFSTVLRLKPGDAIVGLQSSGLHSNGFSLVRKIFNISERNVGMQIGELGHTLGEELLTPTKIYVKPVLALMEKGMVKAASHITGGGFYENVPRMLKEGVTAKIEKNALPEMPFFRFCSIRAIFRSTICTIRSTWASGCALPFRRKTQTVRWKS